MKIFSVVFALALLFCAVPSHADSVSDQGNYLIIPDSSTVTSNTSALTEFGVYEFASFTFSNGTGNASGSSQQGESGSLFFTTPVSDVSFTWEGQWFSVTDSSGDNLDAYSQFNGSNSSDLVFGTWQLTGTGITWIDFGSSVYAGGIESISYTLDNTKQPAFNSAIVSTPEPAPFALLLIGIVGVFAVWNYRKYSAQRRALENHG